jgi:hypothetical protein
VVDASASFDHPGFAPYRRWLRDGRVPDLATLNAWARDAGLALPDGRALAFVEGGAPSGALAYEAAILHDACIHVRRDSWHDAFNALAWLAFPRAKAALNACHVAEGRGAGANARTRSRDAATLLDESGLIVACGDDAMRQLLEEHAWQALFVARRAAVASRLRAWALGHGLLEKLMAPYRALTAHVLWLPVDLDAGAAPHAADAAVAARLCQCVPEPGDLLRLPVAALPGWDTERLGAALFDDAAVFRPARARLAAP